LGFIIHTEAAEAIAIIRWIVDAIGVKTHGRDAVVTEEKVRDVLGKMGMTSLITRAKSACHGNFSEKYLDFHYVKELRYGRNQDILMVRVMDDFFRKTPLGVSFDFPLPTDTAPEDMYFLLTNDGFLLPKGYMEIRQYIREEKVEVNSQSQSSSSWDSILRGRKLSKGKKRGRKPKAVSSEQTPQSKLTAEDAHATLLDLIGQTGVGGIPYRILEERTSLNGELEDALDELMDAGLVKLFAGISQEEDIYVSSAYFDDD